MRNSGHVLVKVLVLITVLLGAVGVIYYILYQVSLQKDCTDNLIRIYSAMEMYEIDRGALPRLAFFPDDPKQDSDSLRVALEAYGADAKACLCPTAPDSQTELGLAYVWNVKLNGRKMARDSDPEWMLVEISALSADVPAPHLGQYNVLYTDGKVRRVKYPLQDLHGL
jgi:hypothetical protein